MAGADADSGGAQLGHRVRVAEGPQGSRGGEHDPAGFGCQRPTQQGPVFGRVAGGERTDRRLGERYDAALLEVRVHDAQGRGDVAEAAERQDRFDAQWERCPGVARHSTQSGRRRHHAGHPDGPERRGPHRRRLVVEGTDEASSPRRVSGEAAGRRCADEGPGIDEACTEIVRCRTGRCHRRPDLRIGRRRGRREGFRRSKPAQSDCGRPSHRRLLGAARVSQTLGQRCDRAVAREAREHLHGAQTVGHPDPGVRRQAREGGRHCPAFVAERVDPLLGTPRRAEPFELRERRLPPEIVRERPQRRLGIERGTGGGGRGKGEKRETEARASKTSDCGGGRTRDDAERAVSRWGVFHGARAAAWRKARRVRRPRKGPRPPRSPHARRAEIWHPRAMRTVPPSRSARPARSAPAALVTLVGLVPLTSLLGACDDVRVRRDLALYDDAGRGDDAAGADLGTRAAPDALAGRGDARSPPPPPDEWPADAGGSFPNADAFSSLGDAATAPDLDAESPFPNFDAVASRDDGATAPEPDAGGVTPEPEPDAGGVTPEPEPDAGGVTPEPELDAGGPPPEPDAGDEIFLTGVVRPADERTPVVVEAPALGLQAQAVPPDFTFTLGPLPADTPVVLRAGAAAHQSETLAYTPEPGVPAVLPEPLWLYRGVRVSEDVGASRLFFGGGDDWLLWQTDDVLSVAPVAVDPAGPGPGRVLVPSAYELFLGFTPGPDALSAVVRRRGEPGLAGDVEVFPLAPGARPDHQTLFQESQPWLRWIDHRALALVRTRQALSQLVIAAPGGPITPLAEGVPWLLVTRLQSGEVAYAAGAAPEYAVRLDALDGSPPRTVSPPDGPAGDAFLSTSPDGRRLYWRTPTGTLWVYDRAADAARPLAFDVAATPRPTLLADGGVYFWRGAPEAAGLFVYEPGEDAERRRATAVDARTFYPTADGFFVTAPGRGLLHGLRVGDDEAALAVPGTTIQFAVTGPGALVLADGVAFTFVPGAAATRRGGEGLSRLEIAPTGATAWQADAGRLLYIPGPGRAGDVQRLTVGGAAAPERVTEPAREAIYVRDVGRWRRVSLPPAAGPDVEFSADATRLLPLDAARVLGADDEGTLRLFDPDTGRATGWARNVDIGAGLIERGPLRRFAAYGCDRGVFVVPLDDVE
jgi:hypothetical protein